MPPRRDPALAAAEVRVYGYQDHQYDLTLADGPWGERDWTYDKIGKPPLGNPRPLDDAFPGQLLYEPTPRPPTPRSATRSSNGFVLSIVWDDQNRPLELWLRDLVKVYYRWGTDGRCTKEVVDLRDGQVVLQLQPTVETWQYHQSRQATTTQPRRQTRAQLPGVGAMVEWDDIYNWSGHGIASFSGLACALLPLDGVSPVMRSATPFLEAILDDRVDYTADSMVLHLVTDHGGSDNLTHTFALVLPRRLPPETQQTAMAAAASKAAPGAPPPWRLPFPKAAPPD